MNTYHAFTLALGAGAAVGALTLASPAEAQPGVPDTAADVEIVTKIGNCPADREVRTTRTGRMMGDLGSNNKAGGGGGIDGTGHNTTGDPGSAGGVTYTRGVTRNITYITITCKN